MPTGKRGAVPPRRGPSAEPFTIVNPPPNVTGWLHIGHALDNTLQDILIRHARLQGKDALWVVGTDHAGIATQMVVERQLEERQQQAHQFQPRGLRRQGLGVEGRERRRDHPPAAPPRRSCDWANERFTMDAGFTRAVLKVFVDLYNAGPALPRQAAGELGPGAQDRHLRPRGRDDGRSRANSGTSAIRSRTARGAISSPPPGPRRCSPTWRWRCIPTTRATRRWSARRSACRSPAGWSRSSPTSMPIRSSARARSRSPRATISTTSRSASAPASSPARCSTCSMPRRKVVQTADGLIPDELLGLDRFDARKRVVELMEARGPARKGRGPR